MELLHYVRAIPPRNGRMRVVAPAGANPAAVVEEMLNSTVFATDAANANVSWVWPVRLLCGTAARVGMPALTVPTAGCEGVPDGYQPVADLPNPQDVVGCAAAIRISKYSHTLGWRVFFVHTDADAAAAAEMGPYQVSFAGWWSECRPAGESKQHEAVAYVPLRTVALTCVEYNHETQRYGRALPLRAFSFFRGESKAPIPCTVTGPDAFGVNWVSFATPQYGVLCYDSVFAHPDDPNAWCFVTGTYFQDVVAWRPHTVWDVGLRRLWMAACVAVCQGAGSDSGAAAPPASSLIALLLADVVRVCIPASAAEDDTHRVTSEYAGMVAVFL